MKEIKAYPSVDTFREALQDWVNEWKNPSVFQRLNENQRIYYLGKYYLCSSIFFSFIICAVTFLASKIHNQDLPAEVSRAVAENSTSIITKQVENAIKNLSENTVANGLWAIRAYGDFTQGTSAQEGLNSVFSYNKSSKTSHSGWEYCQ